MRKTTFVSALAMLVLASFLVVPGAHAGATYALPVIVYTVNFSGGSYIYAEGTFSDTRSSSDTTSYMRCGLNYNQGWTTPTGYCSAYSATTGEYAYCYTTDPPAIQVIASMKDDSLIEFEHYTNSSTCSFVSSEEYSGVAPKK